MSPVLVIVGAPGAGKTTVGTAVARRLTLAFRDTDRDIETSTGRSISDIFVEDGEPVFRELEHEAVLTALHEHDGVLALGGGAVTHDATRDALMDHRVVWLRVGLAAAAQRVGLNRDRPLLMGNVRNTLHRLMDARGPLYAQVSDITVDTDTLSVDDVVEAIVVAMEGREAS
jgi:shikimate kinase